MILLPDQLFVYFTLYARSYGALHSLTFVRFFHQQLSVFNWIQIKDRKLPIERNELHTKAVFTSSKKKVMCKQKIPRHIKLAIHA
jgi:hypothetical protein